MPLVVAEQLTDKIISIEGPQQVYPGSDVVIQVSYEASAARKVMVVFQKKSSPWPNYGFISRIVGEGRGVLEATMPISFDTPIEHAAYEFIAFISTKEGSRNCRLDDLMQNHIDCIAEPRASNNDKWALSLSKDIRHPAAIENFTNGKRNRRIERQPDTPPKQKGRNTLSPFHNNLNIPAAFMAQQENIRPKNLLKNGDFSKGITNWHLVCYGESEGALSITPSKELLCTTIVDSGTGWHVRVQQDNLMLKNGQHYQLAFRARAKNASRQLRVLFKMPENIDTFLKDILLSDEMTEYEFNFTVNDATAENCQIEFHCGGAGDNGVILDDISLIELACKTDLGKIKPNGEQNTEPLFICLSQGSTAVPGIMNRGPESITMFSHGSNLLPSQKVLYQ